jgi:hypothetical protein
MKFIKADSNKLINVLHINWIEINKTPNSDYYNIKAIMSNNGSTIVLTAKEEKCIIEFKNIMHFITDAFDETSVDIPNMSLNRQLYTIKH